MKTCERKPTETKRSQKQKGGKCKRQIEKRGMGALGGFVFGLFNLFSFIYVFLDTKQNLTSNNVR